MAEDINLENKRLQALLSCQILDTEQESDFDDVVKLATSICNVPIALVSLVDDKRQWFKAKVGLEVSETPKGLAFCAHAIKQPDELFIIQDARKDERFKTNPLVTSFPDIVFYAGAPIVTEDGYALGTVCVIDTQPRELTETQKSTLKVLANQVSKLIELKKSRLNLEEERNHFMRFAELSPNIIYRYDSSGETTYHNSRVLDVFGYSPVEFKENPDFWTSLIHPDDIDQVKKEYESATENNAIDITYRMRTKSNNWRWIRDRSTSLLNTNYKTVVEGIAEDVTDFLETQKSLEDIFAKYKLATSASGEGIWEWELATGKCFFSDNWSSLLGFSEALTLEHIDQFRAIIHPEDLQYHDSVIKQMIEQKLVNNSLEFRLKKADATHGWFLARGSVVTDNNGNPVKITGSTSEITEQKKIKQELLKTKELLEDAGRMSKIGAWEVDIHSGEVYWSKVTREIHEVDETYEINNLEGVNFYKEGLHRKKITNCVNDLVQYGIEYDDEFKIITAKGTEKWVRAMGKREVSNEKTVRIYGTFQDIDQQKKAQEELLYTKNKLESIFNEMDSVIWSVSLPDYKLIFSTPSAEKLYECKLDEWKANPSIWIDVMHPEDKHFEQKIWDKLARKNQFDVEYRIITKSGIVKWIRNKGKTIFDAQGIPLRLDGITTDITYRKRAEIELKEVLEVTQSQNERLKNYAYIVSHNLRSHSANISSLLQILKDEASKELQQNQVFEMLNQASENLLDTIAHLSDIALVNTLSRQRLEKIDLNTEIQKSISNVSQQASVQKVAINYQQQQGIFIKGLHSYVESIFLNLLTNAIKYASSERVSFVEIEVTQIKDKVIVAVKDNGLGIDLSKYGNRVFRLYERFHKNEDSRGLGLFMVKNQIEALKGNIQIKSEVNVGTTFTLEFLKA